MLHGLVEGVEHVQQLLSQPLSPAVELVGLFTLHSPPVVVVLGLQALQRLEVLPLASTTLTTSARGI